MILPKRSVCGEFDMDIFLTSLGQSILNKKLFMHRHFDISNSMGYQLLEIL